MLVVAKTRLLISLLFNHWTVAYSWIKALLFVFSVKAIFSARLKFGVYSEIRRLLSAGKEGGNSPLSSIKGAGTCHLVFKVGE